MNTEFNSAPWQTSEAPRDRAIWLRANIVITEEAVTSVEPFEALARWNEDAQDWHDARGMSIRMDADAEMVILQWIECAERAKNCPEKETMISAHVYLWAEQWRVEAGTAGWFALCDVRHIPTCICIFERIEGPFATRSKATEVLTALISGINLEEAAKAA